MKVPGSSQRLNFERRIDVIEGLIRWGEETPRSIAKSRTFRTAVELVYERNVVPELNGQNSEADRVLALALLAVFDIFPEERELYSSLEQVVELVGRSARVYPLFAIRSEELRQQVHIDSVRFLEILVSMIVPIVSQQVFSKDKIPDSLKFSMLNSAIQKWRKVVSPNIRDI